MKVTQFGNTKAGFRGGVIARYANATTFYVFLVDGAGSLRLLKDGDTPAGAQRHLRQDRREPDRRRVAHPQAQGLGLRPASACRPSWTGPRSTTAPARPSTIPAGAAGAYVYGANTIVEFDDVKVSTP